MDREVAEAEDWAYYWKLRALEAEEDRDEMADRIIQLQDGNREILGLLSQTQEVVIRMLLKYVST